VGRTANSSTGDEKKNFKFPSWETILAIQKCTENSVEDTGNSQLFGGGLTMALSPTPPLTMMSGKEFAPTCTSL
jgi:hypothetical protein